MATKNEPIGEVECPVKNCTRVVPVYRYRGRPNERMQRFANKLYCRCPAHGKSGGDPGDDEMQTYLEDNAKKCASETAGNPAESSRQPEPKLPAVRSSALPEIPQKLPAVPAVKKPPAVPATPAETEPEITPQPPAAPAKKPFFYWE